MAYQPADFEANGKYRPIEIVAKKDGKGLQVHARKGYRAGVATAHRVGARIPACPLPRVAR